MNLMQRHNINISKRILCNFKPLLNSKVSYQTSKENDIDSELPASFVEDEALDVNQRPENFFNKSSLLPQHRRMLHETRPYNEPNSWIHNTERYQRKMFGRYGFASNVNPRICFPTKNDKLNQVEYERVANPYTLQQMMEQIKIEKMKKKEAIQNREEEIRKKLAKLEQWKAELNAKVAKKESDALAAKDRKERLIEEVRRHFGFKIDPRDERFKELLEQKEKEDRKKQKEAKRKVKEEKMMSKLVESTKNKSTKDTQSE